MAMAKNPSGHRQHEAKERGKRHGLHLAEWLKREESGVTGGSSGIFFASHDQPLPPERTCIQGHEIPPGQDRCSHGHPVG
ncbi:hypothetical protein [Sinomonas terrae]|uniref:Uncharacterized protein n=1 Tax=Sinomonas terrae TaxID=2908838 RepID=A0ABS9TZI8_9MICC|nr:hypothetical protein [Sinomonas terrae]MCH6469852.1 hypothetical protein [Sinomonas terrae]